MLQHTDLKQIFNFHKMKFESILNALVCLHFVAGFR